MPPSRRPCRPPRWGSWTRIPTVRRFRGTARRGACVMLGVVVRSVQHRLSVGWMCGDAALSEPDHVSRRGLSHQELYLYGAALTNRRLVDVALVGDLTLIDLPRFRQHQEPIDPLGRAAALAGDSFERQRELGAKGVFWDAVLVDTADMVSRQPDHRTDAGRILPTDDRV